MMRSPASTLGVVISLVPRSIPPFMVTIPVNVDPPVVTNPIVALLTNPSDASPATIPEVANPALFVRSLVSAGIVGLSCRST